MLSLITHQIEGAAAGPEVLITAGVHGDEYEPMLALYRLLHILPGKLLRGRVVLVPVVNADAAANHSRTGSDGLDLARVCPGKKDGTVTEQAAAGVSELIVQADYLIDLHTGGKVLDIHPMTGYVLHASEKILEQQRIMAKVFGLPVIWGTDAQAQGRTLSVARDAEVPAIYAEYGGGATVRNHITEAYVEGCINFLRHLGMMPGEPASSQIVYTVEDDRPGQGHLQSKLPSPVDGVFIPSVTLGDKVEAGEVWGHVADPLSGSFVTVNADVSGLVLFLRADAVVKKGDSLGGILPLSSLNTQL